MAGTAAIHMDNYIDAIIAILKVAKYVRAGALMRC